jgi:hypothetical protein
VLQLEGVVGPAEDLRQPVLGPGLAAQVPDRLERRQGLAEQAPRDLVVADVGLDAAEGEQRPGLQVPVTAAPGQVPGRVGRLDGLLVATELDQALGPSK